MEFREAIVAAMAANVTPENEMEPMEMLAVMAQLVGNLIASQDAAKHTTDEVLTTVSMNIEEGNKSAINEMIAQMGGRN
jgi:hypothetical protein